MCRGVGVRAAPAPPPLAPLLCQATPPASGLVTTLLRGPLRHKNIKFKSNPVVIISVTEVSISGVD